MCEVREMSEASDVWEIRGLLLAVCIAFGGVWGRDHVCCGGEKGGDPSNRSADTVMYRGVIPPLYDCQIWSGVIIYDWM